MFLFLLDIQDFADSTINALKETFHKLLSTMISMPSMCASNDQVSFHASHLFKTNA